MRTIRRSFALLLTLSVLIVAACGGSAAPVATAAPAAPAASAAAAATVNPNAAWDRVVAAAKTEAKTTIYTSEVPAWIDKMTAEVKRTYSVDLVLGMRGAGTVIGEKLTADQRANANVADAFLAIEKNFFLTNKDWFINLKDAGIPNYDKYPAANKFNDLCVDYKLSVSGILYNKNLVPAANAPKKWTDMADPFWKGKLMIIDPRASANYMGWAIQMQKAYGTQFLTQLQAQNPALQTSAAPAAEQTAAGAYAATFSSSADASSDLRAKGAPLTFVVPEGPTIGSAGCMGILKAGKNQNAAKVLMNQLLTAETQSAICKAGVEVGSPLNADGCVKTPPGWTITPLDPATGAIFGTTDAALRKIVTDAFKLQ